MVVIFTMSNVSEFALTPVSLNLTSSMMARVTVPPPDMASLRAGDEAKMRAELSVLSLLPVVGFRKLPRALGTLSLQSELSMLDFCH